MDIDMEFDDAVIPAILAGHVTATTRRRPHGQLGDVFTIGLEPQGSGVARFEIVGMHREPAWMICSKFFQPEGFPSPVHFWEELRRSYPGLDPDMEVTVHFFRRIA